MGRLDGKRAIVTGGVGIGAGIATRAAEEGAGVMIADIDLAAAEAIAEGIRVAGGNAVATHLDLADEASVRAMIDAAVERFGGLDAIVNNAAKTSLTARDTSVETIDTAVWDETLEVNLRGTMLACKHALPVLRAAGGGAIVNIASGAAFAGSRGLSAYGVSKAGVIALGRYIATQHGHEGIRCNTISPGIILTPKTVDVFGTPDAQARLKSIVLSPRLGMPADIAAAAVWLIAEEGAYVTGQCIRVDGGMMAHQLYLEDLLAD